MIRLDDTWAIDADAYQYILGTPEVDKKGISRMTNSTFHRTLQEAGRAYARRRVRECIGSSDMTLQQALSALCEVEERIHKILDPVAE